MIEIMERIDEIGETLTYAGNNLLLCVTLPIILAMLLLYFIMRGRLR